MNAVFARISQAEQERERYTNTNNLLNPNDMNTLLMGCTIQEDVFNFNFNFKGFEGHRNATN